MLRTSLFLAAIALIALLMADLEISTLHPWTELSRMAWGAVTPDLPTVWDLKSALLNTVVFALCGIFLEIHDPQEDKTGYARLDRPSRIPRVGLPPPRPGVSARVVTSRS